MKGEKMTQDEEFLKIIQVICPHSEETKHGTLDAVNPYDGMCCICGKQVKEDRGKLPPPYERFG